MGCLYVMYLRLKNSSFCLIWAKMNHFEARLVVLLQRVELSRPQRTQDGNLEKVL